MKRKVACIILVMIVIAGFIANYFISFAHVSNPSLYLKLSKTDSHGIGYGDGNPLVISGDYIWNIENQDSLTGPASTMQKDLYCVKADYGETWFTQEKESEILEYNLYYNIQSDREELLAKLQDNSNDADDVIKNLLNPEGTQYKELLWLFDNAYIKNKTDIKSYLESVGILSYEYEGNTYYYYVNEHNNEVDYPEGEPLTEEDIIAIQRMAIWYFTNGIDKTAESVWLWATTDGTSYNQLKTLSESRNAMANDLYKYLINGAKNGASQYTAENEYQLNNAPASVDTTGLVQEGTKYVVDMTRKNSDYLIGPIIINENNDLGYDINIEVRNHNNNVINKIEDYVYTDQNGNVISNDEKDLVGLSDGFYIKVERRLVENASITVTISYNTTAKKLWLQGTENDTEILLNAEQPIVELIQDPQDIVVELISKPKEFDLALRKYITEVNGKNVTDTRVPNISLDSLQSGTTATYNHRKDPVVIKDKDEVTYKLTIYNEGNKTGFASKIVDQLPVGLINSTSNSTTVVSKDKNGNDKNTYNLSYITTTNQIILTIVNTAENPAQSLQPYTITNGLDSETIEIKCKVAQEADTKDEIVLTNVAWIALAYDSEDNKEISSEGTTDRDSQPQIFPAVEKDNMEDYKGHNNNKAELDDSSYFYKGKQDDDDFEKLVLMPIPKKFDLALFKHIAAISKDQKIEEGEYVTDNGKIDGQYLRAPYVTAINSETGKITYKQDDKAALIVEPGDYVLYTIRVYNEGEINGYASKIKDTLPIGLEFVIDNEEYNGIWNLDGLDKDGRQVISTTWYAKGQGAEINTEPGDANYKANLLMALNKEGEVSNEEPANPDFLDAQVLCRVVEQATSKRVLVNYAEISDDSDEDGNPIEDDDSTPDEWIDTDDDQDIERIIVQYFDLSIRKFITNINETELKESNGKYSREPDVDVTPLKEQTDTTAIYNHSKDPVSVKIGDKIIYTLRVYNEGSINGFASEVKDYLPPYLTFVKDSDINTKYGWEVSEDGRIATTKYLKNHELKAFDGTKLDYADIKIECIVSETAPLKQKLTNITEISEYTYNGGTVEKDIDSKPNNMVPEKYLPTDENLPKYKDDVINESYVPGNEDDDDFEKIYIQEFDLALRKFITKVQDKEITARIPEVKIEENKISYNHTKEPVYVHVNDIVTYTIRIFNEGEIDGYASEITDDIPEYLEYLPEESTNVKYMWKMYDKDGNLTEKVEDAVKVKTEYLAKENGEDNLIKAFDGTTLSYKDIEIAFRVKDPNSNTYIITNHAQISDDTDKDGKEIDDKDSTTDKWIENEDDQDIENIKVEYFDLSLLKFVSKVIVIEDNKQTVTETGYNGHEDPEPVVKVELHKKKLSNVIVKFGYGITITNEGDIPGYATEITDYVPEGLKFDPTDNPEWMDEGNNVISTRQLENVLLQPGESKTIEVIFTWINGKDNLGLKTNTAEISEDKNEFDVPDRDSTPDNKKEGEDDIDIAKVILAVSTGRTKTYFTLTFGLLATIAIGIILIKKFVI